MLEAHRKASAALLATVVVISAFSGVTVATGINPTTVSDPGSGSPAPGDTGVLVLNLTVSSDDAIINDHDGTADAAAGGAVGAFDASARYYDNDGSGGYSAGDEVYLDDDGDGAFTGSADTLVAGSAPSVGASIASNGQDTDWSIDSIDGTDTDAWDPNADTLYLDDDADGAYTAQGDTKLAGTVPSAAQTLTTTNPWTSGVRIAFVDANTANLWESGSDLILRDDDADGNYTGSADTVIDTNGASGTSDYGSSLDASAGDSVVGAETVSITAGGTDAGNELYYVDSDGSGGYSSTDEIVMDPNAENASSLVLDAGLGGDTTDNDSDGTAGDDVILSHGSDDSNGATEGATLVQFVSSDGVAFENVDADGAYADGEDIVVDATDGGTISTAADSELAGTGSAPGSGTSLKTTNPFTTAPQVAFYDGGAGGTFESGSDVIVTDAHNGGTYSAAPDTKVAGTTPADGTASTSNDVFDANWSLDVYDATDTDAWDANNDAILVDTGDRGTYSAAADTELNAGGDGVFDLTDGDGTNDLDETTYGYVDVDGSSGASVGDEVYTEGDGGTLGSGGFGNTLNAITFNNTGSVADADVSALTLYQEGSGDRTFDAGSETSLGTGTLESGNWTLSGLSRTVGVGGTQLYVTVDLSDGVSDGETLAFEVPSVSDGSSNGAYESGDTGAFFAQGSPVGDVANGGAVTVDHDTGGSSTPTYRGSDDDRNTPTDSGSADVGADGRASVDLSGGHAVKGLEVALPAGTTGTVSAEEVDDLPQGVSETRGKRIALLDVHAPDPGDGTAVVRLSVSKHVVNAYRASPEELTVEHYDADAGEWETLDTSVASTSGGRVVLEAETSGFSLYAVTQGDAESVTTTTATTPEESTTAPSTTTATPQSTTTPAAATTGEPTTTTRPFPGFGPVVALVALLAVALLATRRE